MISWLQKNKKYSHIAIWVSTIAFVGAGFVGWGQYDYNSNRANAVATVGNEKITLRELQISYNNLYSYYSSISGGKFNKEEAKKMGLEQKAFQNLVDLNMMINIAKDFGLSTSEEEIKDNLISTQDFHTNGVFDKEKYYLLLKNAQITAKEFENEIKKQILVNKLLSVFDMNATGLELETINSANNLEDRLSISIQENKLDIRLKEDDIKSRWENSKKLYLTLKSYTLQTYRVKIDDTNISKEKLEDFYSQNVKTYSDFNSSKEIIKRDLAFKEAYKEAKLKYLHLKKGKIEFTDTIKVDATSDFEISKIEALDINATSKPIKVFDGYIIAKLVKINPSVPMSYSMAKNLVKEDLRKSKREQILKNSANKLLENFEGKDIGFISSRDYKIDGLSSKESFELIKKVYFDDKKSGYVIFDDKSVIYKITDQRMSNKESNDTLEYLKPEINSLKSAILKQNLMSSFKDKYKTIRYK